MSDAKWSRARRVYEAARLAAEKPTEPGWYWRSWGGHTELVDIGWHNSDPPVLIWHSTEDYGDWEFLARDTGAFAGPLLKAIYPKQKEGPGDSGWPSLDQPEGWWPAWVGPIQEPILPVRLPLTAEQAKVVDELFGRSLQDLSERVRQQRELRVRLEEKAMFQPKEN